MRYDPKLLAVNQLSNAIDVITENEGNIDLYADIVDMLTRGQELLMDSVWTDDEGDSEDEVDEKEIPF